MIHEIECGIIEAKDKTIYQKDPIQILNLFYQAIEEKLDIEPDTYVAAVSNREKLDLLEKDLIREWFNKVLISKRCVSGMRLLMESGVMDHIIPGLKLLVGLEQNKYHFGDVWQHTLICLQQVILKEAYNLELRLAALLHDAGKVSTETIDEKGVVHFKGHEKDSSKFAEMVLEKLGYSDETIKEVMFLVENHMVAKQWGDDCSKMSPKALRKLQYKCGRKYFMSLLRLIDGDNRAHIYDRCYPNQFNNIMKITHEMMNEGVDMLEYELPISIEEIMEFKEIDYDGAEKYLDHCLKLAYNNPRANKEYMLNHIKNLKL